MTTASIWQNHSRLVWYCTFLLGSTISHVILVAWNHAWWEEMQLGNWANTENWGSPPERKLLTRSFRALIIQGWLEAHEWKPVNQLRCWSNSQSKGKSGPLSWIASTLLRGWHFTYWTGENGISISAGWQFTTDNRRAWQRTRKEHTFCPQTLLYSVEMRKPTVGESFKTTYGWDTRAQVSHFAKTLRRVSRQQRKETQRTKFMKLVTKWRLFHWVKKTTSLEMRHTGHIHRSNFRRIWMIRCYRDIDWNRFRRIKNWK